MLAVDVEIGSHLSESERILNEHLELANQIKVKANKQKTKQSKLSDLLMLNIFRNNANNYSSRLMKTQSL